MKLKTKDIILDSWKDKIGYLFDYKDLQELKDLINQYENYITVLKQYNVKMREDISFCLRSIEQEMNLSTDSRTRQEMSSCYQILREWRKM